MTDVEKLAICAVFKMMIDGLKESIIERLDDGYDRIMPRDVAGIFSDMWEREEFCKFIAGL